MVRLNIGLVIALFAASAIGNPHSATATVAASVDDQRPLDMVPVEVVAGRSPPPVTTGPPEPAITIPPPAKVMTKVPESTIAIRDPRSANPDVVAEDPPAPLIPDDAGLWRLRMCESTDRYGVNTGNGYYGGYQFDRITWNGVAERWAPQLVGVRPDLASPADQDAMTRWLWSERGGQPWPVCRYRV